ncbi:hypothetical protein SAMN05421788_111192 [Filimonas lacunae]|uniref:TonB dependent receptor n=1 Tax=Filimonas lacunae TaxID=477680 RepID=A0A173MAU8_9BACT|nr:hypothetical protein [Filimonas lacunae]BAV04611.1 TonB-dependent receptor [Filimonas lacunae]SIT32660.1 hypothetical protein SAMN05421788_111192 [Filimonas lacunae]
MKRIILILLLIGSTAGVWAQKRKPAAKSATQKQAAAKKTAGKNTAAKKSATSTSTKSAAKSGSKKQDIAAREEGDTLASRTVVVTSSFKPALRNAAKVNFSAASPQPDSVLPQLQYRVPSQNLFFSYEPASLKPMALSIDSTLPWENNHYIKAGFGNYTTPYLQAGFAFGDGKKTVVNAHVKHTSSKGSLPFQRFSKTGADIIGVFNPNDNIEWDGKVSFNNDVQYQYGFAGADESKNSKDSLRQRFTTIGITAGLRNKQDNGYGVSYHPTIAFSQLNDNKKGSETNFKFNAPITKTFGENFAFNLGVTADLTHYKSDSVLTGKAINNNLFYISPALQYKSDNLKIVGGFIPSWDNKDFHMLPDITAEAKIKDERFILQLGWTGYYHKTTYQSLSAFNPWLQQPKSLLNARINEQFAGFKGSAGSHFTYNARVSYLKFNNQPLFVNDTTTGRSFEVINEEEMKAIRLHGEIGYTIQEKFSVLGGATFTQYSNLKTNEKAYGLVPFEINGSLRWEILKDVMLKSDIYFWDGARYRSKTLQAQKLDAAVDLNAGIEFGVMPRLNVWVQFNNLLNNKYQRWNQYEVLGFNVLGGVVYSFGQSSK